METLTIDMSEEEERLIGAHASALGISVSEFVRYAIMDYIEDDLDTRELIEAIREDDGVRYTMGTVLKMVSKTD